MIQGPTRQNHYVPIWYQKGFIVDSKASYFRLDLDPPSTALKDGRILRSRPVAPRAPQSCFWSHDLYTTRFGEEINDQVERYFFGRIDNDGASAVRAFAANNLSEMHKYFRQFFEYLDAQKLRTPKGLDWIKGRYPDLTQLGLMIELQGLRQMHCTMWYESVREVISAEKSAVKFIVTDHPVTIYNAAFPPESGSCRYPEDPAVELVGSQTVFPLDADHCLVLSNLEYARNPQSVNLRSPRTNARYLGQSIARTDAFIRSRSLGADEVVAINALMKTRAVRYVAASKEDWLYPDRQGVLWTDIGKVLLPPANELWRFGGEIYIGHKDGSTQYQDEFGRTSKAHEYLRKKPREGTIGRNDMCGCGSGRRYRACCEGVPQEDRPSWRVYSIRERNLMFCRAVKKILEIKSLDSWDKVREELSDEQVKKIHEAFSSLWPEDTDISELLPRPDEKIFRALYLGLIDPRTVSVNVLGWLPYFDEIVIPHPFINAVKMKPDVSPIHSPSSHKSQTLKNALVLITLEPFIRDGLIHMIPDPSDFKDDFRMVMWGMAKERTARAKVDEKETAPFRLLADDDFMRATRALPEDSLKALIRRTSPEVEEHMVDEVVALIKEQHHKDPLALLQPMAPGESGGQFQFFKGFNLELALFFAQFTGSSIYTDVPLHWNHLHAHASAPYRPPNNSDWKPLVERINRIAFNLDGNPNSTFRIRNVGDLDEVRNVFRQILRFARTNLGKDVGKKAVKQLAGELRRVRKNIRQAWTALDSEMTKPVQFEGRMKLSVPNGGFERPTVRRLLLTFGRAKRVKPMPLALFFTVGPLERSPPTSRPT
jgi:hypothetical protein